MAQVLLYLTWDFGFFSWKTFAKNLPVVFRIDSDLALAGLVSFVPNTGQPFKENNLCNLRITPFYNPRFT
jgi:hypothetical protein